MENWRCMMFSIKKTLLLLVLLPVQLFAQQKISGTAKTSGLDKVNQSGKIISLDTLLKRIENNNLLLQTYSLQAKSFSYKAQAATAWMAPMVGIGTYMTPYPGLKVMDDRDKGSIMFELEQEIPNPAKLKAQQNYIASKGNVEMASRELTLNELKAQAKSLYYNWMIASQRIKVLQENAQIMAVMKKIAQIRYPYNQSKLSGIFRADAKIEENQNMIRMQEGEIAKAKAWLNSLMNLPGNQELQIDTAYVPQFLAETSLDTANIASQRKDIFQMEERIRSMKLGLNAMKVQAKPDFKIRFDHMAPLSAMMPRSYNLMAMASIPIVPWSSKMYKSEVKAMNYEIQAMEKQRAGMLQESQGMLYGMQYQIQNMQKRLNAMEDKIVPALKKTMDADFAAYQENKLELPAVIGSWEALNMMQNEVLEEKMKLYQMITDYEKQLYR